MKIYKLALRIWIGLASVLGFLGGWALLAHSGKPVPFTTSSAVSSNVVQPTLQTITATDPSTGSPIPTLPPLPTVQSGTATPTSQPVQLPMPSFQISSNLPQLRSRGS